MLHPCSGAASRDPATYRRNSVARISRLLHETIQDPEFLAFMENAGTEFGLMEDAEAFQRAVMDEIAESRELLYGLHLLETAPGSR